MGIKSCGKCGVQAKGNRSRACEKCGTPFTPGAAPASPRPSTKVTQFTPSLASDGSLVMLWPDREEFFNLTPEETQKVREVLK